MKKIFEKVKKVGTGFMMLMFSLQGTVMRVLAAEAEAEAEIDVKEKITNATDAVKIILTGIVCSVAVCVAIFIIIKKLPDADNPHEKHELYRGVGRVFGIVALAAACIWVIPWVYGLFT